MYTDQTDAILPGGVCSTATATCSKTPMILDGAKRDRRPWSGDLTVESRTMFASLGFGPGGSDYIKDTIGQLRLRAAVQRLDLRADQQLGQLPDLGGDLLVLLADLLDVLVARARGSYYLYSGDTAFAEAQYQT